MNITLRRFNMENMIESQVIDVVGNLVVGAVKSLARTNKRGAALLSKLENFDKNIREHNEFMDSIVAVLKPALHLAHEILAKFLPGYMHIVDVIVELGKDIYAGLTSPA
jgi:hypothetical protein